METKFFLPLNEIRFRLLWENIQCDVSFSFKQFKFQSDFVLLIRIDRPNGTTRRKKRTFNRCFGQHSAITRCDISLIAFSMPFQTFIAKLQPCVVYAYFIMCLFICSVARCVRVQYSYSTVHTVYMQMNPAWPLAIASPSVQ